MGAFNQNSSDDRSLLPGISARDVEIPERIAPLIGHCFYWSVLMKCANLFLFRMFLIILTMLLPTLAVAADSSAGAGAGLGAPVKIVEQETPRNRVMIGDVEIVDLKSGFGSLSGEERANFVSAKLLALAKEDTSVDTVRLKKSGEKYKVVAGDQVLMVISPVDAEAAGMDIEELAFSTHEKIRHGLIQYRDSRSLKSILLGAVFTVLSALALVGAIMLIQRGIAKMNGELHRLMPRFGDGLKVQNVQILSANRIEAMIRSLLSGLKLLLIIFCLYFFVPLILSFFAVTRSIGRKVFALLIAPLESIGSSFVAYIPNFFYIFVIGVAAYYILRVVRFFFVLIETGDLRLEFFYTEWARPTYQIVRVLVIVMAIISAFPYVPGSGSAAFQGVGLVLGLVLSFASSSAISNIIAGIILVYTRAFKIGDRIKVNDTVGDVIEKTLLVTRLKTPKNVVITIPNSLVLGTHILNYSSSRLSDGATLIIHTTVTIGYDADWKKVHSLLVDAANRTDGLDLEPSPFVLQSALSDFYVAYEINAYTHKPHDMPQLYSDLHQNIQDVFNEAGVEIMSPHYQAQRDGNATTVSSIRSQPGYVAPRFEVNTRS